MQAAAAGFVPVSVTGRRALHHAASVPLVPSACASVRRCPDLRSPLLKPASEQQRQPRVLQQRYFAQSLQEFAVDFTAPLGVGACSSVFAGTHLHTSCNVAIKTMRPAASGPCPVPGSLAVSEGVENESSAFKTVLNAGGLSSPNVVELLGLFDGELGEALALGMQLPSQDEAVSAEEPMHYFVTELLEGGSLQDFLDEFGPMPEPQVRHLTRGLCQGIASLHDQGIVHRDIKPANVLFGRHGLDSEAPVPKLIDFSHAGHVLEGHAFLTGELGTRGYVAPEVLSGRPYCRKCDIFSLGCVVHAMLSGGRVPRRQLRIGMVHQLPASVSREARLFLTDLLCMDPAQRPGAEEVLQMPWLSE
eukprot:TRINITY_DN32577_c0_g1_i1.p1 TRINITY_DN32577_c0_g1~~TRINITY_DN32577_c0_g1_i1.p1  ORF type:complete len:374 (+),score=65.86 TRINITY_DN32577_c0_g1_i1:40-1122(+)